jgi:hypothetical protein
MKRSMVGVWLAVEESPLSPLCHQAVARSKGRKKEMKKKK